MKVDKYEFPDDLYYHKEHTWAKKDGDSIIIGFDDFGVQLAGAIKRITTLEEDEEISKDKPFGTISSGKWTGKLYSPISGEIVEVNEDVVEDEPGTLNEDPYGEGWLLKVTPEDDSELDELMQPGKPDFDEWIKAEIAEHT